MTPISPPASIDKTFNKARKLRDSIGVAGKGLDSSDDSIDLERAIKASKSVRLCPEESASCIVTFACCRQKADLT